VTDDLDGAGITAKERLANIEHLLSTIDTKLDGKASQADLIAVELRLRDVEFWRAETQAAERVAEIERSAADVLAAKRIDEIEATGKANKTTILLATGGLSTLILAVNVIPYFLK
jgi:hypothetical protein